MSAIWCYCWYNLEFTLMVFRYNLMELGTIWWSLGTIQWFLRRIWWFLGTIWWIVGTIWSKGAVSFIFSRSVEKHATNFPSDWKFISSKSVFLTSPTPHMWSLTSLLRYRFWRRVNIPVSIQERFSCLSEFRDVFRQAIGTFESGGALNVMLNLFGLDIFLWINRKKKTSLFSKSCTISKLLYELPRCNPGGFGMPQHDDLSSDCFLACTPFCLGWSWRPSELSSFLLLKKTR